MFEPDPLNPKFTFFSPIHDGAADLAEHVDRAIIALDGRAPIAGDCTLEPLGRTPEPGTIRVDLWVEELGRFFVTYGFTVSSESGSVAYARGERTVLNLDPRSHAPADWDAGFLAAHAELRKDLPNYA